MISVPSELNKCLFDTNYYTSNLWNAKNKKKILPLCRGQWPRPSAKKGPLPRAIPLPSAKIHWKNSGTFLCRGPWLEALGKDFFLKKIKFLCRGPAGKPSAKIFQKKWIILCRGPSHCPRQRFFKKKNNSLPRAPGDDPRQRLRPKRRRRDGCFSLPSAGPALGKGFAECPIKGPRQRPSSSTQNSPRALCRGPPSAKPLPRVNGPLPRASGPRQRFSLQ